MADFGSGTLFYRALDVVPVLTPELEAGISVQMDEARICMLKALVASAEGRIAFLDPLLALAAGERVPIELIDRGWWQVQDWTVPEGRRAEFAGLAARIAGNDLTVESVMAIRPNWSFIERIGCEIFAPETTGVAAGRTQQLMQSGSGENFHSARALHSAVLERLVEANIRLVIKWARRYGRLAPVDEMDLVQEGCEGLISAARRFDFHRGFRFSTYAVWWIRQAIIKSLMKSNRLIRLPAHAALMRNEIGRVKKDFLERWGRFPTEGEIGEELGVTPETLLAIHQSSMEPLSLDKSIGEDSSSTVHDVISISTPGTGAVFDAVKRDLRKRVSRALKTLDGRERMIVTRKYGLDGSEPETLAQIGRDLDLSRERVRQLEFRALQKLRKLGILFPEDGYEDH